ncbi:MAG: STAS domain-containing protein [Deltaproteobacteria bacterium]|nr:STAS domain-containing protein [Deltaproteobacteria bacterium]MBW1960897.1 STAS domain-containing protein [Deltaproteobacteria bacterium]MBW2152144.1 STAS domain-containing protein [Deltaproteobacteria bacterium]
MSHEYQIIDDSTALVTAGRELSGGKSTIINELRDLCRRLSEEGKNRIIFDFSRVKLCPSMVFGNIIVLNKRLKEKDGGVAIAAPSSHTAKAARITGLTKGISIFDSVEEAIKAIKKTGG